RGQAATAWLARKESRLKIPGRTTARRCVSCQLLVVCPPSNLVEERTVPWKSVTTKKTSADGKVKEAAKMGFKTRTNCILRAFSCRHLPTNHCWPSRWQHRFK